MKVGDIDIHVEVVGKGPNLTLLHGGPGLGLESLKPVLEQAAEFATVVFYDQRGCGGSTKQLSDEGEGFNVESHISDLEGVRSALGLERMTLLGHSWGAFLALAYAIKHEHKLNGLILVSPTTPYPETAEQLHRWHSLLTPVMRREIGRISTSNLPPDKKANERLQVTLPLFFRNLYALNEFRQKNLRLSGEVIEEYTRIGIDIDLRRDITRLRLPVTIIAGRHDLRTPVSYAEEIASLMYDANVVVLEDSGHFPYLEQPKEFMEILRSAMQAVEAADSE